MSKQILLPLLLVVAISNSGLTNPGDDASASAVISQKSAVKQEFDWGSLITYFDKDTYGTKDVLAAVAIIKPGLEIHPPHKHAEEEYLMVTEGTGTWHLKGKDFKAQAGDMLYASPWDLHGIKNTGEKPLSFVVWKWNNKGLDLPAKVSEE